MRKALFYSFFFRGGEGARPNEIGHPHADAALKKGKPEGTQAQQNRV